MHKIEFDELFTPLCSPSIYNCQDSKRVVTSAYFGQTPHCAAGSAYWTAPADSAFLFPADVPDAQRPLLIVRKSQKIARFRAISSGL